MVYKKIKIIILDMLFELYGMLHNWFLKKARECLDRGETTAFDRWARRAEKCIDKRSDILEQYFA
jgi:hypothetical protein